MQRKNIIGFLIALCLFSCHREITPVKISDLSQKKIHKHFDKDKLNETYLDTAHIKAKRELIIDTIIYPIQNWVDGLSFSSDYFRQKVLSKVRSFYSRNNFKSKWLERSGPNELYYAFAQILKNAGSQGLNPEDYNRKRIHSKLNLLYQESPTAREIAKLDVRITASFFLFTTHLIEGRLQNPGKGKVIWKKDRHERDDIGLLLDANRPKALRKKVDQLLPQSEEYKRLQKAYVYYRGLANSPGASNLSHIAIVRKLNPGDTSKLIPLVRKRLSFTDLKEEKNVTDSLVYGKQLVEAVKWFQYRHGLNPDGVIGKNTAKYLNKTFGEKTEKIKLNMERMRWLSGPLAERHIIINIPDFKLRVFRRHKKKMEMGVIVGKKDHPTPIFSDTLEYIEFSPTWTVPFSIIDEEIIPELKKDPLHYAGRNFVFYKDGAKIDPALENWNRKDSLNPYQYRVVQQPGPGNALGKVKFMMPNKMSIYLHDTPADQLFSANQRAFSHGCIRLEKPEDFAKYLLKKMKNWNAPEISAAMELTKPKDVYLNKIYGVRIVYLTAWIDEKGLLNFRNDIYGLDKLQNSMLHSKNPI